MGLFSKIKQKAFNEFIDIIEWIDNTTDTIVWRFPRYQSEIKNGAQLVVRESQIAVLVDGGKIADIYSAGRYELTTQNMPILTTLRGWKYGFNSPFKVEVYFISTKQFLNIRWGTANPIMLRDAEFGPIRMRAFGSYNFRINVNEPVKFIQNVSGTNGNFTTENIAEQLRNFIITRFTDHLAESKIVALDLASNLNEFSGQLTEMLKDDFAEYGIELTKFLIENISLPDEVEKALDQRTKMGIIGGNNMNTYTQMQWAESLQNPNSGGIAGDVMGAGMGWAMAQQMMNAQNQTTPPPLPKTSYFLAIDGVQKGPFDLTQLQQMILQNQIKPNTLAWKQGMADWVALESIEETAVLFRNMPPPIR